MDGHSTSTCPECGKSMGGTHGAEPCSNCMNRLIRQAEKFTKPKPKPKPEVEAINPFEWPDYERNLYINGTLTSFGGLSPDAMSREELVMFIGFLDGQLSATYMENLRLKEAINGTDGERPEQDRGDSAEAGHPSDGAGV